MDSFRMSIEDWAPIDQAHQLRVPEGAQWINELSITTCSLRREPSEENVNKLKAIGDKLYEREMAIYHQKYPSRNLISNRHPTVSEARRTIADCKQLIKNSPVHTLDVLDSLLDFLSEEGFKFFPAFYRDVRALFRFYYFPRGAVARQFWQQDLIALSSMWKLKDTRQKAAKELVLWVVQDKIYESYGKCLSNIHKVYQNGSDHKQRQASEIFVGLLSQHPFQDYTESIFVICDTLKCNPDRSGCFVDTTLKILCMCRPIKRQLSLSLAGVLLESDVPTRNKINVASALVETTFLKNDSELACKIAEAWILIVDEFVDQTINSTQLMNFVVEGLRKSLPHCTPQRFLSKQRGAEDVADKIFNSSKTAPFSIHKVRILDAMSLVSNVITEKLIHFLYNYVQLYSFPEGSETEELLRIVARVTLQDGSWPRVKATVKRLLQKGLSLGERGAFQILVIIEEILWNHRAFRDIGRCLEKHDGEPVRIRTGISSEISEEDESNASHMERGYNMHEQNPRLAGAQRSPFYELSIYQQYCHPIMGTLIGDIISNRRASNIPRTCELTAATALNGYVNNEDHYWDDVCLRSYRGISSCDDNVLDGFVGCSMHHNMIDVVQNTSSYSGELRVNNLSAPRSHSTDTLDSNGESRDESQDESQEEDEDESGDESQEEDEDDSWDESQGEGEDDSADESEEESQDEPQDELQDESGEESLESDPSEMSSFEDEDLIPDQDQTPSSSKSHEKVSSNVDQKRSHDNQQCSKSGVFKKTEQTESIPAQTEVSKVVGYSQIQQNLSPAPASRRSRDTNASKSLSSKSKQSKHSKELSTASKMASQPAMSGASDDTRHSDDQLEELKVFKGTTPVSTMSYTSITSKSKKETVSRLSTPGTFKANVKRSKSKGRGIRRLSTPGISKSKEADIRKQSTPGISKSKEAGIKRQSTPGSSTSKEAGIRRRSTPGSSTSKEAGIRKQSTPGSSTSKEAGIRRQSTPGSSTSKEAGIRGQSTPGSSTSKEAGIRGQNTPGSSTSKEAGIRRQSTPGSSKSKKFLVCRSRPHGTFKSSKISKKSTPGSFTFYNSEVSSKVTPVKSKNGIEDTTIILSKPAWLTSSEEEIDIMTVDTTCEEMFGALNSTEVSKLQ